MLAYTEKEILTETNSETETDIEIDTESDTETYNLCSLITINFFSARTTPFRIVFKTDADEANVGPTAADGNESAGVGTSGNVGFSLRYTQAVC